MHKLLACLVLVVPSLVVAQDNECVDPFMKGFSGVAGAQAQQVESCVKDASRGKLDNFCFSAGKKVSKARAKTVKIAQKKCKETPDFGPDDPLAVNRAAERAPGDLVHDVFGDDLDVAILRKKDDKEGSKCQLDVARELLRCEGAHFREFVRCSKKGVKKDRISDAESLGDCIGEDPKNKIRKACDAGRGKVRDRIKKKCSGVDLDSAFPGCSATDNADLALCIEERASCRACLALNEANETDRDCDELDDGELNASCP